MTREEMIKVLSETYGWDVKKLETHNEAQIYTLFSACKNEDGTLRKPEMNK